MDEDRFSKFSFMLEVRFGVWGSTEQKAFRIEITELKDILWQPSDNIRNMSHTQHVSSHLVNKAGCAFVSEGIIF